MGVLVQTSAFAAGQGQAGEEAPVGGVGREGERGELVSQVGLAERRDLQASRKSTLMKLLEAFTAGGLKCDDVLRVPVPVAEGIRQRNRKISNGMGDLSDLIPGGQLLMSD